MSDLVPRRTTQPDRRALNITVAAAEQPGIRAAARIHAGGFAASAAMHHAAMLSRAADVAFRVSPMGEDVYRSILMAYGNFAATEIQALSLQDREQ